MLLWWIILGIIAVLAAVVLIRAALYRTADNQTKTFAIRNEISEFDIHEKAGRFAELIRCRTIHPARAGEDWSPEDYSQFLLFRDLLKKFYPLIHTKLELELVNEHSLLFRWPGRSTEKPLVLMAHYDVVPADNGQWSYPPFSGKIADNIIWGRGSLDTKCTLFAILEAVETLLAEAYFPQQDIYLAFGHDEETMGRGAPAIVDLLESRSIRPAMVLDEGGAIVEGVFPGVRPPIAVVGMSEKGLTDIEVILEGSGGHSSTPGRLTPLAVMSKIILQVDKKPFKANLPDEVRDMFAILGKQMPFGLRVVFANLWLFKPLLLAALPIIGRELNALCRTTCVFTMAEASKAANVIPERVRAVANLRLAASDPHQKALQHLTNQAANAAGKALKAKDPLKLTVNQLYAHDASPSASSESAAYKKLVEAIETVFQGVIVTPYIMLGASDSRHFCRICQNVFRFTPLKMSKEELRSIHGIDEHINFDQLAGVIGFYYHLVKNS
jgi:carboxypeptidase PM20D1